MRVYFFDKEPNIEGINKAVQDTLKYLWDHSLEVRFQLLGLVVVRKPVKKTPHRFPLPGLRHRLAVALEWVGSLPRRFVEFLKYA